MALLTEFTACMLIKSCYGDKASAIELAKVMIIRYGNHLHLEVCKMRHDSLLKILSELENERTTIQKV